jgi:hypothetical protein
MEIKKFVEGRFIKADDAKQGEVITFLDEGTEKELNGKKFLTFQIEYNGEEKLYSPNKTALVSLTDAWGTETSDFIGKSAKINLVKVRNPQNGQMVNSIFPVPVQDIKDMPENLTPEELSKVL